MKIVLNSDILLSLSFAERMLPAELAELCRICNDSGIPVVLPETTLLEFERRHSEFAEREMANLAQALLLIERFSIAHDPVDPRDVIKEPDLVALLEATGVTVEVISPSFDDYREAHRRACKHLPPSTDKKSDEMRDVIIWLIAIGVAHHSEGAVLIAKDQLFHDGRVDDEAQAVGLIRVKAVEDAFDRLHGLRPRSEILAAKLVLASRDDLIQRGIHLPDNADQLAVSNLVFTIDSAGFYSSAAFDLAVEGDGAPFHAAMRFDLDRGTIERITLTDIESETVLMPGGSVAFSTSRPVDLDETVPAGGQSASDEPGGQGEPADR